MTVGILVVKDQAPTVDLCVESVAASIDRLHVIDNGSTDGTPGVISRAANEVGLPYSLQTDDGYVGHLFRDAANGISDHVLRIEGDQVFFKWPLQKAVNKVHEGVVVNATSILLRNRFDLRNANRRTNAPHPTVYPAGEDLHMVDGRLWPRTDCVPHVTMGEPVAVNCRVNTPTERLLRWHRAPWWRWGDRDVPAKMRLPDTPMPYREHLSLEEYVWRLRELDRGSIRWPGDTLEAIGEAYVAWDTEQNCVPYEGPWPAVLERALEEGRHGA